MAAYAAVSAVVGILLSVGMVYLEDWPWVLFLGVAHAIVFIPAMVMSHAPMWKMIVASVVCVLFPVWGFMGVMFIATIGSPFVCSFLWGLVVAWAVRRPIAILFFAITGGLSNAGMFISAEMFATAMDDWAMIPHSIGIWHLLMFPTYCWMMSWSPRPLPWKPIDYSVCQSCEYPIAGLPENSPCPECGTELLQCQPPPAIKYTD